MSLISDELLRSAIEAGDNSRILSILEPRVQNESATESERLLCGVLLLMPPIVDEMAASDIFKGLFNSNRGFEAAVWDAYRYLVLFPDGNADFIKLINNSHQSSIAAHVRSRMASASGDIKLALFENRKSRLIRSFPFNVIDGLKLDGLLSVESKSALWSCACDLIISRDAENDSCVGTVEGLIQRHWDNLITGTRITSILWDEYNQKWGNRLD